MKRVTRKIKQKPISERINVTLPFELHDWSETLTFNQITDTIFIVGQFLNNDEHPMFTPHDLELIKDWMTKNDIRKFLRAKEVALAAQEAEMERQFFAQEIMQTPYRRPSSH